MERILSITGYEVKNNDDLREVVPAAFSGNHNRSKVYSFVSTTEILENLAKLGWVPTYAKQQGTSEFSRHIIRLTNPELGFMPLKNDNVRPQLILDNSHNGISSAQLHMGLFRLVCQSELVICIPNLFNNIKFRHMGLKFEELKEILSTMSEQYKIVGLHISEMQGIILSEEQQKDFTLRGVAYKDPRFIKDDGTIDMELLNKRINANTLLEPMRGGDKPITLWDTFQNVREWLIKGGYEQVSPTGRKSHSKAINNAVRQIALNKTLWVMAEEYLSSKPENMEMFNKLVAAANVTPENNIETGSSIKTYTNSKGVKKQVMVIADLGDGNVQVKDVNSKTIFSVAEGKLS
jgi:hypothetical protein